MKRELIRTGAITLGLILLLPLFFGVSSGRDFLLGVAMSAFFLSLFEMLAGFIMVFIASARKYAQALLLCAALLMLFSFTLCSTGAANLNI